MRWRAPHAPGDPTACHRERCPVALGTVGDLGGLTVVADRRNSEGPAGDSRFGEGRLGVLDGRCVVHDIKVEITVLIEIQPAGRRADRGRIPLRVGATTRRPGIVSLRGSGGGGCRRRRSGRGRHEGRRRSLAAAAPRLTRPLGKVETRRRHPRILPSPRFNNRAISHPLLPHHRAAARKRSRWPSRSASKVADRGAEPGLRKRPTTASGPVKIGVDDPAIAFGQGATIQGGWRAESGRDGRAFSARGRDADGSRQVA